MADNKLSKYTTALTQAFRELIRPSNMRKYGEQAAAMIKLRTRLGQGVERDGAEKTALKSLSDRYKKQRKALQKEGKLSDQTSPGKSNLTRTGQMLDSQGVTSVGEGEAFVGPSGTRDDGKKNEDVAAYVTYAGRPFNNLSKIEVKRVNDAIKSDLKKLLAQALTKARR
jgi:hypothetical protein